MISKHRELFIFICMLLIVPLAGEPRIHPFGNEFSSFRVSFGSPMFLLFLLWLRNVPMAVSGLAVGIAVVLFRGALDAIGGAPISTGVYQHIPTFFYYFTYAICFSCMKLNRAPITTQAMKIAFWAIIAEVIASIAELYTMDLFLGTQAAIITVPVLARLTGIAFLRCFTRRRRPRTTATASTRTCAACTTQQNSRASRRRPCAWPARSTTSRRTTSASTPRSAR